MLSSKEIIKINTRSLCIFCLRQSSTTISTESLFRVLTSIRPHWTLKANTEYRFCIPKNSKNKFEDVPPVCTSCESDASQINALRKEIAEIEERLKEVRTRLGTYVENVKEKMKTKVDTDPSKPKQRRKETQTLSTENFTKASEELGTEESYDERYERLLKFLSSSRSPAKIMTDTVDFLASLKGMNNTISVGPVALQLPFGLGLPVGTSTSTSSSAVSAPNSGLTMLVSGTGVVLNQFQGVPLLGGGIAPASTLPTASSLVQGSLNVAPSPKVQVSVPNAQIPPVVQAPTANARVPLPVSKTLPKVGIPIARPSSSESCKKMRIEPQTSRGAASIPSIFGKKATLSSSASADDDSSLDVDDDSSLDVDDDSSLDVDDDSSLDVDDDSSLDVDDDYSLDVDDDSSLDVDEDSSLDVDDDSSLYVDDSSMDVDMEIPDSPSPLANDPLSPSPPPPSTDEPSRRIGLDPETSRRTVTISRIPMNKPMKSSSCILPESVAQNDEIQLIKPPPCPIECEACSVKYPAEEMPNHMYAHVGEYACKCPNPKCNYTFVSRWSKGLERHLRRSRIGEADRSCWRFLASYPQFIDKKEKMVLRICHWCGQKYTFWPNFQAHVRGHEKLRKEKTLPCPVINCEERFALRQSVEIHLVSHKFPLLTTTVKREREKQPQERKPFPIDDPNWIFEKDVHADMGKQKCDFCGVSQFLNEMPSHMASHVGEYGYQCPNPECKYIFVTQFSISYREHLKKREKCWLAAGISRSGSTWGQTRKICDTCGEEYFGLQKFGSHLNEHETHEKNFSCPVTNCKKKFTVRQSVEYHLRSHTLAGTKYQAQARKEESLSSCTLCKKELQVGEMSQHLQVVHKMEEGKLIKCQHCPLVSVDRDVFLKHVSTHMKGGTKVLCDLCQEEGGQDRIIPYLSVEPLRRHYFEKHGIGKKLVCEKDNCEYSTFSVLGLKNHIRVVHEGKDPKPFKCHDCSPTGEFADEKLLRSHRIRLHGADPIKCRFCSDTFTSFDHRNRHEKINHEGKIPTNFVCEICGASLSSSNSLRLHVTSVHGEAEKKWSCDQCGKSFKFEQSLKRHITFEHEGGAAKFMCEVCGRKLRGPGLLKQHMRIHTGERPFLCKVCGLRFRQQCSLRTHMISHKVKGDKFKSTGTFDRVGGHGTKKKLRD